MILWRKLQMIKNQTIKDKIDEQTKDDPVMREFLLEIINQESESSQYTRKYKNLIDNAVGGDKSEI